MRRAERGGRGGAPEALRCSLPCLSALRCYRTRQRRPQRAPNRSAAPIPAIDDKPRWTREAKPPRPSPSSIGSRPKVRALVSWFQARLRCGRGRLLRRYARSSQYQRVMARLRRQGVDCRSARALRAVFALARRQPRALPHRRLRSSACAGKRRQASHGTCRRDGPFERRAALGNARLSARCCAEFSKARVDGAQVGARGHASAVLL
jgi:hypothetical protein